MLRDLPILKQIFLSRREGVKPSCSLSLQGRKTSHISHTSHILTSHILTSLTPLTSHRPLTSLTPLTGVAIFLLMQLPAFAFTVQLLDLLF